MFEEKSKDSFLTVCAKQAKLRAEMDDKYLVHRRQLQKSGERLARQRELEAQVQGRLHTSVDMPITGVPAKFLLAGLMGGPMGAGL